MYRVEQVFLIHRKTGLLLQHVRAQSTEVADAQMVSAMGKLSVNHGPGETSSHGFIDVEARSRISRTAEPRSPITDGGKPVTDFAGGQNTVTDFADGKTRS